MRAQIVLGLVFGDEGKGITTDYLCSQEPESNKLVVRFSGGHQAAHCVRVGNKTHIFSNFASGCLRGVPSYFSQHCTVYPITLSNELAYLKNLEVNPSYFFHPLAKVTTPMDVIFNHIQEKRNNHGSCGLGIGTTMNRHLNTGYKLSMIDFSHKDIFYEKLRNIENYYLSLLSASEKPEFYAEWSRLLLVYDRAIKKVDLSRLAANDWLHTFDTIIFEGSQGILLDMDHGIFPNVTYANTTSKNAIQICQELKISDIETYYVTRCYQTRHGNGWMNDTGEIKLINNEEETNFTRPWQGDFRVSELDYSLLDFAFSIDSIYNRSHTNNLVVTCLDQRPGFEFDKSRVMWAKNIYGSYSKDSKDFKLLWTLQKKIS